jgi:hypothetical protein
VFLVVFILDFCMCVCVCVRGVAANENARATAELYCLITDVYFSQSSAKPRSVTYRGADKSLAQPTSRCILFDG